MGDLDMLKTCDGRFRMLMTCDEVSDGRFRPVDDL